jgi:hypothetical protein
MILSAPIFVAMRTQLLGSLCVFFNMAFAGNLQIAPQATGGFVHAAASRRSNFGNVDSPPLGPRPYGLNFQLIYRATAHSLRSSSHNYWRRGWG